MSNDLLFSILPREGKVPIVHDEQKVHKVSKESAIRELNDKEQELHLEEREARQQQHSQHEKTEAELKEEQLSEQDDADKKSSDGSDDDKHDKGFKHLDIYV